MKRINSHSFIYGVLATLLAFGFVGTATATVGKQTIAVDYKDMLVQIDYRPIDLTDANGNTVEPFAYNGTTYVPIRAVASAFGCRVDYGESLGRGYINLFTTPSAPSALSADYPFTGVPRLDGIVGQNAFCMSFPAEKGNTDRTFYEYYKPYFIDGTEDSYISLYDATLKAAGFKLFQTSTVNNSPMYHYVNDETKVFVSLSTANDPNYVAVLVNTEQQKKSSAAAPSSPASSSASSSGSDTASPSPAPSTDDNNSPKFDGKCPICGIACFRDYLDDTYEVWKCRNPKCTHYDQVVYP